jgi:hypothetical protein
VAFRIHARSKISSLVYWLSCHIGPTKISIAKTRFRLQNSDLLIILVQECSLIGKLVVDILILLTDWRCGAISDVTSNQDDAHELASLISVLTDDSTSAHERTVESLTR